MEYEKMTLMELRDSISSGKIKSEDVVKFFLSKCEEKKELNAFVEIFDDAIEKAKEIDAKVMRGEKVGKLAGVPVAIKDNILYKGKKASCASKFMKDFVAPYSSTVVEKLLSEDAVVIGRTNMDEFAMGGSCENSFYGPTHNAVDSDCVAGGSSSGSAVAVASGMVPCAIGTDTGGSIRQPASFNGVVGVKPTYGTVSRYGIVAFASSLDQASPIAKTVEECEYVLKIIAGKDEHDSTTIENNFLSEKKEKYTLGICKEISDKLKSAKKYDIFDELVKKLGENFEFVEVSVPHISHSLACYYILAPAEATSNLARFDGVKYTPRSDKSKDIESVYVESRSDGFGKEVKRRIMLGNFVLSSGYFDAYYNKAKKVQRLIKKEFVSAFEKCDAIMLPTTFGPAFKIGEKVGDPVSMYMEDLFTVPANIAGIPAVSVPYAVSESGLPLGMQLFAKETEEAKMFEIAKTFQASVGGDLK